MSTGQADRLPTLLLCQPNLRPTALPPLSQPFPPPSPPARGPARNPHQPAGATPKSAGSKMSAQGARASRPCGHRFLMRSPVSKWAGRPLPLFLRFSELRLRRPPLAPPARGPARNPHQPAGATPKSAGSKMSAQGARASRPCGHRFLMRSPVSKRAGRPLSLFLPSEMRHQPANSRKTNAGRGRHTKRKTQRRRRKGRNLRRLSRPVLLDPVPPRDRPPLPDVQPTR
jgi:hypothetical protein